MSGPITRKRARLESSNDNNHDIPEGTAQSSYEQQDDHNATRTRDKDFWYDDGTVMLVAGSVEFRVYKGILSENSSVFRDMFSLPQPLIPSTALPTADGCPVVHLSDSPKDLRHVLRVYTHKNHPSPFESPEDPSFAEIAAVARLAHKYQMTRLFDQALAYLKTYYTNNYDAWYRYNGFVPPGFSEVEAIGVVNLARFLGETSLLPTALLACCQLGREIVDGFKREDGTREQLALHDIGLCFAATPRLVQASIGVALHALRPVAAEKCTRAAKCRAGFRHLMLKVEKRLDEVAGADPFLGPFVFLDELDIDIELCRFCRVMAESRESKEKRAVWARLPEILGIAEGRSGTS